jgi:hypothetical protein
MHWYFLKIILPINRHLNPENAMFSEIIGGEVSVFSGLRRQENKKECPLCF